VFIRQGLFCSPSCDSKLDPFGPLCIVSGVSDSSKLLLRPRIVKQSSVWNLKPLGKRSFSLKRSTDLDEHPKTFADWAQQMAALRSTIQVSFLILLSYNVCSKVKTIAQVSPRTISFEFGRAAML